MMPGTGIWKALTLLQLVPFRLMTKHISVNIMIFFASEDAHFMRGESLGNFVKSRL